MYSGENKHLYDKSGKSIQVVIGYDFPSGDNSQIVCINWSDKLEKDGLMMFGQMTAGSWIYIGTQGILQGTYETFIAAAKTHWNKSTNRELRDKG